MDPRTLSASGILKYLACPAGFKASYIDRSPDTGGPAATLGTACHEAIEMLMREAWPKGFADEQEELATLIHIFMKVADRLGLDVKQRADGGTMLENWWKRCGHFTPFWDNRMILSMETKETFPLTIGKGEEAITIPVTYIWDRCDEVMAGGSRRRIEVIDYKSFARPVSPDDLKLKPQVRIYALAAALKYRNAETGELPEVWVKLDLLRYDLVGVKFTDYDHRETWKWLQSLWRDILLDDGYEERINAECKWCVRRLQCKTLHRHSIARGIHSLNVDEAAVELRKAQAVRQAMSTIEAELTEIVMTWLEDQELMEHAWQETGVHVKIGATGRRDVDSAMAARVCGPELVAKYGRIGVTQIDTMLKSGELTEPQARELKELITQKVTPKLSVWLDEDDEDT